MREKKNLIRIIIIPFLKLFNLYSLAQLRDGGVLVDYGWFRSFREKRPVDGKGNPLPWFSYPLIYFLEKRIKPHFVILELGAGNSTLWWSQRVSKIVAYEHSYDWYTAIKQVASSNIILIYTASPKIDFAQAFENITNKFDIIIIDGEERVQNIKNSLPCLSSDGIIILDDSERREYAEGIQYLIDRGFRRIEFYGMTACVNLGKETSIFYRTQNCLNI
jgi:hypothetical protein